ncbi:MAG TPA: hypothetical protein VGQ00_01350 [Candidatus Norongarragalinales archaeon]|nr:hypothetical protein [Candidatus Norongarragalinales archaeon]
MTQRAPNNLTISIAELARNVLHDGLFSYLMAVLGNTEIIQ